jgi:hypothetical protein
MKNGFRIAVLTLALLAGASCAKADDTKKPVQNNCVEPFCTYAPPKLTGQGMANALFEILRASPINQYMITDETSSISLPKVQELLTDKNIKFVDPTLVAEKVDDPKLVAMFGKGCLEKLTHFPASGIDATGPFFVYKFHGPAEKEDRYIALSVFGVTNDKVAAARSYVDRVKEERSSGINYIFDSVKKCNPITTAEIHTKQARRDSKYSAWPRLFGVGYQDGSPFFYELLSLQSKSRFYELYLQYARITPNDEVKNYWATVGYFPNEIDPFTIVNKQKALP